MTGVTKCHFQKKFRRTPVPCHSDAQNQTPDYFYAALSKPKQTLAIHRLEYVQRRFTHVLKANELDPFKKYCLCRVCGFFCVFTCFCLVVLILFNFLFRSSPVVGCVWVACITQRSVEEKYCIISKGIVIEGRC